MLKKELSLYVNVDSLPLGYQERFNHKTLTCNGSSTSLLIAKDYDGSVSAYCFRCGDWYRDNNISNKRPTAIKKKQSKLWSIPKDSSTDIAQWPLKAQSMLLDNGLDYSDCVEHRLMYSESEKRLIFSAARGFVTKKVFDDDPRPKYLSYMNPNYWLIEKDSADTIVITEDKLSTIIMGKVQESCSSLALFGTNLKEEHLSLLIRRHYKNIYVWLDNDNAIVKKQQIKILNRLKLYFRSVTLIFEDEPKVYFK